ncbi:MAG: hypothetical protein EOP12_03825 [Pseudomonas sp.]|nr:MAG: hypothetical protein EOP12_03825 [Pseudomonas sp.]
MLDHTTEMTAKDRLMASRIALLREMGVEAVPSASTHITETKTLSAVAMDRNPRPSTQASLWRVLSHKAIKAWWSHHPVNTALQLVQPALQPYARKHPAAVIGGGMALGAVLYVVRPWRLLSVSTLAVMVLRGPALPRKIFSLLRKTGKVTAIH